MYPLKHQVDLIEASPFFDSDWYIQQYPDVERLTLSAAEHYIRLGTRLDRDPSPRFSTGFYRRANPDVVRARINPLVHFLKFGIRENRLPIPSVLPAEDLSDKVDVVIPVFNALTDVQSCLNSVRARQDGCAVRVIVVNDGSDAETTAWLREFCTAHAGFELIEHQGNLGYTCAINTGLRATRSPHVVTLNSDTIVTRGWLTGLLRCMRSAGEIGIVGPLSNAASWQNVPELYDDSGAFAVNSLAEEMSAEDMASAVRRASRRSYPRTPFVNGFCFMIDRRVMDAIGYMDEENFPIGYGEENDYCIRAAAAGFAMAIADDAYVFHAKSKSFGHDRRKELSQQGAESIRRKHTPEKFKGLVDRVKDTTELDRVRNRLKLVLDRGGDKRAEPVDMMSMRILFVLPVKGGGGGAHSVVQEVAGMRRMGVSANVAVKAAQVESFRQQYADIPGCEALFVGIGGTGLADFANDYDVVVATIFTSMTMVRTLCVDNPHILPAYYIQDYEPLFCLPGTDAHREARDSYDLLPGTVLFAKTHWIINKVESEHGVKVRKVEPSIDHDVYRPRARPHTGLIRIAAMIRPQTPRRGAARTMRVLSRLAEANPGRLSIQLFGCAEDAPNFMELERGFPYRNHEVLKRPEVSSLLSESDIFIDLSDYQAFGRTALEAMACGCAAIVPLRGGADEYAIDGVNALMVDSLDEDECFDRLHELVQAPARLLEVQRAGLLTASRYSVHRAATSELVTLATALTEHRALALAEAG